MGKIGAFSFTDDTFGITDHRIAFEEYFCGLK